MSECPRCSALLDLLERAVDSIRESETGIHTQSGMPKGLSGEMYGLLGEILTTLADNGRAPVLVARPDEEEIAQLYDTWLHERESNISAMMRLRLPEKAKKGAAK